MAFPPTAAPTNENPEASSEDESPSDIDAAQKKGTKPNPLKMWANSVVGSPGAT